MFFLIFFYIAVAIFVAGTLYRIATWFSFRVGPEDKDTSVSARISAAIKGTGKTLASRKLFTLIRVFLLDGLLQLRILRESIFRWFMHICIFTGFMLLFLMHALDKIITSKLFPQYMATINPYWFLRDIFGALVILGIILAVYRRFISKKFYFFNNFQDYYAIIIIAVILLSGIALNGIKITSYSIYQDMVYNYSAIASDEESDALEAYWVKNFGVVAPHPVEALDADNLETAREVNDMSCASCHSSSQSAPLSYAVAQLVSPFATFLDRLPTTTILYYIHCFAALLMLAYLPFSKMFHIISAPISLMVNAVMDQNSDKANISTRQALELDACTHCGTCTRNCSMKTAFETMANPDILPSEKLKDVKSLISGKPLGEKQLTDLREGVFICSNCRRCTVVCPVGINLQDMWCNVREKLIARGDNEFYTLSPFSFYRSIRQQNSPGQEASSPAQRALDALGRIFPFRKDPEKPVCLSPEANPGLSQELTQKPDKEPGMAPGKELSADAQSFWYCFGCQTCTTVCPIAAENGNPGQKPGLMPHQIMHCLALGMRQATFGAPMLWNCLTCYQCQEHCPQGVKITDIFFELKNLAIAEAKKIKDPLQEKEYVR
jgi:heterodisulfide reductase subunit C/nitrate reductase gamma subunit